MQSLNDFLAEGGHAKIARTHKSFKACKALGLQDEDIFQTCACFLIKASLKPSQAWDPSKGGLCTWAWIVIRTALCRLARGAASTPQSYGTPEEVVVLAPSSIAESLDTEGLAWEARLARNDGDLSSFAYKIIGLVLDGEEVPEELPQSWGGLGISQKHKASQRQAYREARVEAEAWLRENM